MKIAIITAGGAGMFCGSCMQDNTLARALRMAGADAVLLPTYTPIRVDEDNASSSRVFLGGINVYLDSTVPGWSHLPRWTKSWLDRPAIVGWLAGRFSGTDASKLGPLTLDMLNGHHGPHRAAMDELIDWLCDELRPDVILFSNALLSGVVPELRRRFTGRLACLLQGDDIFLDGLPEPWRMRATQQITKNAAGFDLLLTHSHYYADYMQQRLTLPVDKFRIIPLLIEPPDSANGNPPPSLPRGFTPPVPHNDFIRTSPAVRTIGYFARICPEKGVFRFLDAAERFLSQSNQLRFVIAGYLPLQHERRFQQRLAQLRSRFGEGLVWSGSPDTRDEKFRLLRSFDWLCVPTEYHEPKGLFVLEAALSGVPSLLPAHGAFPERIAALGAGRLFAPDDPSALDRELQNIAAEIGTATAYSMNELISRCHESFGLSLGGHEILQTMATT